MRPPSRATRRRRGLAAAGLGLGLLPALLVLPARATTADAQPAVLGHRVIGHSVQGRPIVAWHLGEPGKKKVVLISLMHGNEPAPRRILTDLRDGAPVHDVNLWIVPVYNPDGLAHHTRKNAHGVDPNRNYPFKWVRLTGNYNSGPKPGSEPETRAMMRFLSTVKPAYVLSFHQPLHGVDITERPKFSAPRRPRARPADDEARLRQQLPRHHDHVVQPQVPGLRAHRGVRRVAARRAAAGRTRPDPAPVRRLAWRRQGRRAQFRSLTLPLLPNGRPLSHRTRRR